MRVFLPLFVVQCGHGVDAHGPASRQIAGEHRDGGEDDRHRDERKRVRGADTVQHAGQDARNQQRYHQPQRRADEDQLDSLPQHQREYVARCGAATGSPARNRSTRSGLAM